MTGDVSSGLSTLFADGQELEEQLLTLPLYVHFPGGLRAGERIRQPTEVYDVLYTALVALGLKPPAGISMATDLAAVAAGAPADPQRLRLALSEARYSARWGDYALVGEIGSRPASLRARPWIQPARSTESSCSPS